MSLWSKAFGLGVRPATRVCLYSQNALGFYAVRAGRFSSARYLSAAAPKHTPETRERSAPQFAEASVEQEERSKEQTKGQEDTQNDHPNAGLPLFSSLEGAVSPRTLRALTQDPFKLTHMSPVQAAVLPLLPGLAEPSAPDGESDSPRDLMVKARTGTGKTLGFLIPAVEARLKRLREHAEQASKDSMSTNALNIKRAVEKYARTNIGALILSPTRELATQIANEAIKLTKHHDTFEVRLFVGGLPKRSQLREWNLGRRDIVVATPGRLRDFIENEPGFKEDLLTTDTFILDEADTLLEMGFREDIYAISEHLKSPGERQTFMFSATFSKDIQQVARKTMAEKNVFLDCVPADAPPTHMQIPQYYTAVPSPEEQVPHILRLIAEDQLKNPGKSKVLIFLPTTRMVKLYSTLMTQLGSSVLPTGNRSRFAEMHSKKNMSSRINTSDWFRKDKSGATIMLTSDVSARGVDYPGVTRVIQVGVPPSGDAYVHRVGRTGRGSDMSGRADIVLLPWELGFLTWRLVDIPIQELTTNQLISSVNELAQKYDADPRAFFPPTPRSRDGNRERPPVSFQPNVAQRLGDIEQHMKELQPGMDVEEVNESMASILAFYSSNAGELRVDREVTIAGVHAWAEALTGEKVRLRIPREFMDSKFKRGKGDRDRRSFRRDDRPQDRWMGRGSVKSRGERAFGGRGREERGYGRREEREDREFDWDRDISSGSGRSDRDRSPWDNKQSGDRRGRRSDSFGDRRGGRDDERRAGRYNSSERSGFRRRDEDRD